MGWASGSQLAEELWEELQPLLKRGVKEKAARLIVDAFENHDADDWDAAPAGLYYTAYPERCLTDWDEL